MKTKVTILLLTVVLVGYTIIPPVGVHASQGLAKNEQAQGPCPPIEHHHQPTPYLSQILGTGTVLTNTAGDVMVYGWIAQCGRWLYAIYRNGNFKSHYFPKLGEGNNVALDYIQRQIIIDRMVRTSWSSLNVTLRRITSRLFLIMPLPCPQFIVDPRCRPVPSLIS